MHLFGGRDEPHLVHFEVHRMPRYVTLAWDVRHAPALGWRVLRSETGFADDAGADSVVGSGQTLISESDTPGSRDDAVTEGVTYFYTVFSQDDQGAWEQQVTVKVDHDDHLRLERTEPGDFEEASPADGYWDAEEVEADDGFRARTVNTRFFPDPATMPAGVRASYRILRHHVPMDA